MKQKSIITYILLGVFVLLSIYLLVANLQLAKTIREQKERVEEQSKLVEKYEIKEEADALFFDGKMNEAFDKYKYLDATFQSNFEQRRLDWVNNIDQDQANSLQLSTQLKQELEHYKSSNTTSTHLLSAHELEIQSLQAKAASLEQLLFKQRDSLLNNFDKERKKLQSNRDSDTLSFKSSKNYLVRYYGQVSSKKANGLGSATWSTGGYYFGMWKDNMRHGHGLYTWKDGEFYDGEFFNDKRQGIGKYSWNDGSKYEGSWKNDQRNGFGTLYDEAGKVKFKGEWLNDAPKP